MANDQILQSGSGVAVSSNPTPVATTSKVNFLLDLVGRLFVRTAKQAFGSNFSAHTNVSNSGSQATVTKAAGTGTTRNVCVGFTVTITAGSSAPTATQITVAIIDGNSGGNTYLWRSAIAIPAVAGAQTTIIRSDCWLPGSQATALTIEFSAGISGCVESVSMECVQVAE